MTDHKGLPVHGYAPTQTDAAVQLVNKIKIAEERFLRLCEEINEAFLTGELQGGRFDDAWLAEGRKHIEMGASFMVRSIFAPSRIKLPEDV